ncbi:MAG: hypothetical protein DMF49_07475 [Acidobacteria bacterium]|nr:MAG: hypothetical protein DMF49_07475 [Acidobacteriota bacterium]
MRPNTHRRLARPVSGVESAGLQSWRPAPELTFTDLTVGDLPRVIGTFLPAVGECYPETDQDSSRGQCL